MTFRVAKLRWRRQTWVTPFVATINRNFIIQQHISRNADILSWLLTRTICHSSQRKYRNLSSKIIRSYTHSSVAPIIVADKNGDITARSFHPNYLFMEPIFAMATSLRWRTCLKIVDSSCSAPEVFLSDNTTGIVAASIYIRYMHSRGARNFVSYQRLKIRFDLSHGVLPWDQLRISIEAALSLCWEDDMLDHEILFWKRHQKTNYGTHAALGQSAAIHLGEKAIRSLLCRWTNRISTMIATIFLWVQPFDFPRVNLISLVTLSFTLHCCREMSKSSPGYGTFYSHYVSTE